MASDIDRVHGLVSGGFRHPHSPVSHYTQILRSLSISFTKLSFILLMIFFSVNFRSQFHMDEAKKLLM